jgi:recombinational DNA repair protein (RecF pathway)
VSYHIYQTPAFILGSKGVGEANKSYLLFTRDLGLIYATAQGVRLDKSKLRHTLQDFAFCTISLVRGKEFWRITNTSEYGEALKREQLFSFARIVSLLKRFLHGEEVQPNLFETIYTFFTYVSLAENTHESIRLAEIATVFRVLYILGYVDAQLFETLLGSTTLDEITFETVRANEREMLSHINRALRESHL